MAVTNALRKIVENDIAKAEEKAVEKTATNALTKAGTGALTKLTMDAVLPQASRSALTSLLSPVSHIPVQNMSSGAMDIPVESGVANKVSKYMSKPIDVKDMSSGSLPVAVDTDAGVVNLGQLAERKSIPIQHGDNRPDITRGSELRLADNPFGTHEGVLFSSDKGFTPVGSDGSSDYRNMFYGNTNNQKILDITDPYNAQALERTLGVRGFTKRNGVDMLDGIRSGVTESMGDKGGTLGELLKKNDIGFIKGKSALKDTEYVAANADALMKSYGGDTIARSMEYLDNPGSTMKNLRVGKDITGGGGYDG